MARQSRLHGQILATLTFCNRSDTGEGKQGKRPMTVGSIDTLRAMIAGDSGCTMSAEMYDWYYTSESENTLKTAPLVGNGQCVLLVQNKAGVPHTSFWRKGPVVKNNTSVPAGTAIASGWNDEGHYPSNAHHNHAALYMRSTKSGLVVIDQWVGIDTTKFRPHTLRFGNTHNAPSNDGDAFYVILTPSQHR